MGFRVDGMTDVLLYHHAQGLTDGVAAFAEELRTRGHHVPVQIHGMDSDPIFAGEGDLDAAKDLVDRADKAELFTYPGDKHLFADSSLPSYDEQATALLMRRILDFLERL